MSITEIKEAHAMAVSAPADLASKTVNWGTLYSGNCTLKWAQLYIYNDGLVNFFAPVSTSDSGDVWLVRGLALLDNNGIELYRIPEFDGPRMDVENSDYYVSRYRNIDPLYYPAYLYDYVVNVKMYYHC